MADKGERTSLLAGGAQPQSGGGPAAGGKAATEQPLRLYLSAMPPSVCGLALGICSLGVTWQAAAQFLVAAGWLRVTADVISLVSFNLGCTAMLLYLSKVVLFPTAFLQDARSSVGNSVLPTLAMALMVVSMWVYKHGLHSVGLAVWSGAVLMHVILAVAFARHVVPAVMDKQWESVTPAWMIPPVGISLASSTGAEMGLTLGGHISIFFWIGLSFFAVFYPACLYRALAYPIPPPERQEPLFAIFAAPAALLLSTWITLGGHQGHTLTHFLFLIEMLSIVLVATKIPRLSSLQFSPEHSAFTFPADIAAKACIIYTHLYMAKSGAMVVCSWLFLSLATVAVTVTLLRFCRAALHAIANPDSLADESSA